MTPLPDEMCWGLCPGDGPIRMLAAPGFKLPEGLHDDVDYYVPPCGRWRIIRWVWPLTGWWGPYRGFGQ